MCPRKYQCQIVCTCESVLDDKVSPTPNGRAYYRLCPYYTRLFLWCRFVLLHFRVLVGYFFRKGSTFLSLLEYNTFLSTHAWSNNITITYLVARYISLGLILPYLLLLFAVCCFSSFAFCFIVMSLICMSFLYFAFNVLISLLSMRYYVLLYFYFFFRI